jgi:hypothetical protein
MREGSGWDILVAVKETFLKSFVRVSSGEFGRCVRPLKVVHRPDSGFAGIPDLSVFEAGE